MNITRQQLDNILMNAPAGTTKEGIVSALRQKGYTIEGFNDDTSGGLAPREKKSLASKVGTSLYSVGKFFGMEPLGRGLGMTIAGPSTEKIIGGAETRQQDIQQRVLGRLKKARAEGDTKTIERLERVTKELGPTDIRGEFLEGAPTSKQVVGSALETAGTIALAGAPKAALPFAKGAGVAGTAKAAARAAGIGAGFGTTQALIEDLPSPDIIKRAGQGALAGVAIESMLGGFSRGLSASAKKLRNNLIQYSASPKKAERFLAGKRLVGTAKMMKNNVQKDITRFEGDLQKLLKGSPKKVALRDIVSKAVAIEKRKSVVGELIDEKKAFSEMNKVLQKVNKSWKISPNQTMSLEKLNNLKREIGRKLTAPDFRKKWQQLPVTKNKLMLFNEAASDTIRGSIRGADDLLDRYSWGLASYQALDKLSSVAQKGHALSWTNILSGTLIGAPWFFLHKPYMAIGTALAAISLRSPIVKANLSTITQEMSSMLGRQLTGAERTILNQLITK